MSRTWLIISTFLFFLSSHSSAATFIGNGGSFLDPELRQILFEIERTLEEAKEEHVFASCSVVECEALKTVSDAKFEFAVKFALHRRLQVLRLLKSSQLKLEWTDKDISLASQGHRHFDAVAMPQKKKILINEDSFARMNRAQRITLVLHEIHHLIKHRGKVLGDNDKIGPFTSSRQLLDLQGPLLIAAAEDLGYWQTKKTNRSSAQSAFHFSQKGVSQALHKSEAKAAFLDRLNISTSELSWYPSANTNLGYLLRYSKYFAGGSSLIQSNLRGQSYEAGISLRSRLTDLLRSRSSGEKLINSGYMDHILLKFKLVAGGGSMQHEVSDAFNQIAGDSSFAIINSTVELHLPIIYGFWFGGGIGASWQDFQIEETRFSSKAVQPQSFFSIGYSFGQ